MHALLNKTYARDRLVELSHPLRAARTAGHTLTSGTPPGHRAADWPYAGAGLSNKAGTTHLVVADVHGNVVSMTTTIGEAHQHARARVGAVSAMSYHVMGWDGMGWNAL